MGKANVYALPLLAVAAVTVLGPYVWIWGLGALKEGLNATVGNVTSLPVYLSGIALHEFLHGLGWVRLGKLPWTSVRFGFHIKTLTPYVHCLVPIPASVYRKATALPGIALGVLPAFAALVTGIGTVAIFGTFFLAAACGDFLILWIIRSLPPDTLLKDHPTRAGCIVLTSTGEKQSR